MRISGAEDPKAKAAGVSGEVHKLDVSTDTTNYGACCRSPRRRWWLLAGLLTAIVFITLLLVASYWNFGSNADRNNYKDPVSLELVGSEQLAIVPRANWTHYPRADLPLLGHPTPYVVIKHTASPECTAVAQCGRYLRDVRELHWQRYQQPDISYNFLIDSVGNVYEGRGWNATNVNKGAVYRCNVDVALIGNYVDHDVPEAMIDALRKLLDQGVAGGQVAADYRLLAHNQVSDTISPGRRALEAIKDWPQRCLSDCFEGIQCPQASASGSLLMDNKQKK